MDFLHTFSLANKDNLAKKMQDNVFLMNQRPHAKILLIWKKKKDTQNVT